MTELHRLERVVSSALRRLLGRDPSEAVLRFVRSVGLLIGSDLAGTALTFLITAWFIRSLGPAEFGKANLATSVSQFALIPLLWGLHQAAAHHVAALDERPATIGSLLLLFGVFGALVLPALWFGAGPLGRSFRMESDVFRTGVVYGVVLALSFVTQGILGGLHRFGLIAKLQLISSAALALCAVVFLTMTHVGYRDWIAVSAVKFVVITVGGAISIRVMIDRPRRDRCSSLLALGSLHTLNNLAYFFILGFVGNFMLNAYHGPTALGTLSAYFTSFNIFSSRIVKIISDVLQPMAAAHGTPAALRRSILRGFFLLGWIVIPGTAALTYVLFKFYGSAFVFDLRIALLMGLVTFLFGLSGAIGDLMAASGTAGMIPGVATAFVAGAVNLLASWLLVGRYGVTGTLIAVLLGLIALVGLRVNELRRRETTDRLLSS